MHHQAVEIDDAPVGRWGSACHGDGAHGAHVVLLVAAKETVVRWRPLNHLSVERHLTAIGRYRTVEHGWPHSGS
jgi:hypothetical protein